MRTPLTEAVAAILEPLKGHHHEAVFTFEAKRTRGAVVRGQRCPITYEGAKTEWQRLTKRAGVKELRFTTCGIRPQPVSYERPAT